MKFVHLVNDGIAQMSSILSVGPVYYSRTPQTSFFSQTFIKNESHGTIHTFKIYFATVCSIFNNKRYPNRPLMFIWLAYFLPTYFTIQLIFATIHGVLLHFLILFIGFTVLFQLTFTFIYNTLNKKFSVSAK